VANKKATNASLSEVITLLEKHGTPKGVAEELGVSRNTVRNILMQHGYRLVEERRTRAVKQDK
jgi:hypothetical protein